MLKRKIKIILTESIRTHESISSARHIAHIEKAAGMIIQCLRSGGKILLFGNGGSAADCQHIAAELIGRFQKERRALPAIALTTNTSNLTALSNDYGFETTFSRQVEALGKPGDVAIGISTSGQSSNVINAMRTAKKRGLQTIALSGGDGGMLARIVDAAIVVPSKKTARIQESHITIGHIICELIESEFTR